MIQSLEFTTGNPDDARIVAAMRMAVLTTALSGHSAEGLRSMERAFAEGVTTAAMARALRVEIIGGEAFTVWEQPLSGRVSPPRQTGGWIRLEFTPAEVRAALALIPPYQFGGYA